MGIKNLSSFLKKTYPDLNKQIHISEFSGRKIAIDLILYLYNIMIPFNIKNELGQIDPSIEFRFGKNAWISKLIKFISCLRSNNVHCVFIFDCVSNAPKEKQAERDRRRDGRKRAKEKRERMYEHLKNFKEKGIIDKELIEFQDKRKLSKPLLLRTIPNINVAQIEIALRKMASHDIRITDKDIDNCKLLFDTLGIPYYTAPMEAETMCAELCMQGKVDAVLTEDTDVLAYGAPIILTDFNIYSGTCNKLIQQELLDAMEFDQNQFLDFCIMCGTDYNDNIPRIGPVKSAQMLKQYKCIENMEQNNIDTTTLNYKRVRDIFQHFPSSNIEKIPYCDIPNKQMLAHFISSNELRIDINEICSCFIETRFIVEEDEPIEESN